jgi:hypothetical protein
MQYLSRMQEFWKPFLGLFLVAAASSCSTDVELNAPYNRTPVIFGLLDAAQDTQWVRINHTWLGDGNQYDAALVADSSEYAPSQVNARVEQLNGDEILATFTLKDTTLENKEEGIFFAPEHQAWYFTSPAGLNLNSEYRLVVELDDGDVAEAKTDMIEAIAGNITQPPPGVSNFKYGFANIGPSFTSYPPLTFKWSSAPGARRYDATMEVTIVERIWSDLAHTVLAQEEVKVIPWYIGSITTDDLDGGEPMQLELETEQFYRLMDSRLEADPYITRVLGLWDEDDQIARAFDFVLTIANDELSTYLDISAPVTGIIQERPTYTNVIGGLGLFASRGQQGVYGIGYTTDSVEELINGALTSDLNFCSANPFSDYYCD